MLQRSLLRASDPAADPYAAPDVPAVDKSSGLELAQLASALASHTDASVAADLALDLVLNEIVEEGRLATAATGATVALRNGDDIVCRAGSGNAPGLGVRLKVYTGLSGACIQSRQAQHWRDGGFDLGSESDGYRELGIRSVLMVPIMQASEVAGIFGVFSDDPNTFGDRQVETLRALSRRVIENLARAEVTEIPADESSAEEPQRENPVLSPVAENVASIKAAPQADPATSYSLATASVPETQAVSHKRHFRDYYTDILTLIVVGLALLLGWMMGRAGWQTAKLTQRQAVREPAVNAPADAKAPNAPSDAAQPATLPPSVPPASSEHKASRNESRPRSEAPAPGDLVVYQDGRVIFRSKGNAATSQTPQTSLASPIPDSNDEEYVPLSSEVASNYLLQQVLPVFSEAARGKVILNVFVGKDGSVQDVKTVRGDPQLAAAATDAVRNWRYKPYAPAGSPLNFKTQVTMTFPTR